MRRGRPAPDVLLTPAERLALEQWTEDRDLAPELAVRARIVLRCSEGLTNMEIARRLGVTRETAGKWRKRFLDGRLGGLLDEPRPGAPTTIRQEDVERVRMLAAEQPPDGGTWSTRSMARRACLSQTAVSRIWKIFTLEPHSALPPHFPSRGLCVERVLGLGGLYLDPPLRALALLHRDGEEHENGRASGANGANGASGAVSCPEAPPRPSVFARLDAHARKVNGHRPARSDTGDLITFLEAVEERAPSDCRVHLVLGGVSLTKIPEVESWLRRHESFLLHSIPTSGSWLKLVESWASALGSRATGGSAHQHGAPASVADLEGAVASYLGNERGIGSPFRWTWSVRSALGAQQLAERADARRLLHTPR